jgi:hypothetical protein
MAEQTENSAQLDVTDLVQMFEASEDATVDARQNAERDRDYVDNVQYTADELAAFAKRKQPPIIINRIKRKIDFLKGYEQQQRVNPRALPRTMQHEQDAEGAEMALQYVADDVRFDHKRSTVWDNLLVEGAGGYRVAVKQGHDGFDVEVNRIPWDRMFWDPHSAEPDFSDAGYLGAVTWMDYKDAAVMYPDSVDMLDTTLADASNTDTYDDKPKYRIWADTKRKRVRICQIWVKRKDQWFFAEFTKGGILKAGPSPYVNDKGESDCELFFASAYVNRDNDRYGIVREMIGPQDEINKRRSKALHLLNTNQMVYEESALNDVEKARREAARPDGAIKLNPGGFDKFKLETRTDLAAGHMQLLQEAKNEIDQIGGGLALEGNGVAGSDKASGKAIIASQQGSAMMIQPLMDNLRDLDIRVFRAIWYRIRQFWTEEKWVRITDDERNVKWVGLNVDPQQVEMAMMQNPQMQGKIAGVVPQLAMLDCDIIIDDAPDGITPQLEQFQALVELKKMDANGELPFRALMMAMPNLKNREQILAQMDEASQSAANNPNVQLQIAGAQAKVQETQASAQLKQAQAFKATQEAQRPPDMPMAPEQASPAEQMAQWNESQANVVDTYAAAELKRAQTAKTMQEVHLMPQKMAQDAQMKREQMAQRNRMTSNG